MILLKFSLHIEIKKPVFMPFSLFCFCASVSLRLPQLCAAVLITYWTGCRIRDLLDLV